jgi:hypothetical protein
MTVLACLLGLCAWIDAPKPTGAVRDAEFCQESVPIPPFATSHLTGYYADKLDRWGKPLCQDLRVGSFRF